MDISTTWARPPGSFSQNATLDCPHTTGVHSNVYDILFGYYNTIT